MPVHPGDTSIRHSLLALAMAFVIIIIADRVGGVGVPAVKELPVRNVI